MNKYSLSITIKTNGYITYIYSDFNLLNQIQMAMKSGDEFIFLNGFSDPQKEKQVDYFFNLSEITTIEQRYE